MRPRIGIDLGGTKTEALAIRRRASGSALLLPPKHGDSSGVRGAAWLWPPE